MTGLYLCAAKRLGGSAAVAIVLAIASVAHADTLSPPPAGPQHRHSSVASVHNLAPAPNALDSFNVANSAGTWLVGQQIAVGPGTAAFPWTPGDVTAPANVQGATGMGLLRAYERTHVAAQLNAAIENGNCQISNCLPGFVYGPGDGNGSGAGTHRFATHDALFLIELSRLSGNNAYRDFVNINLWNKLSAGTYGPSANYTADGYANAVLASRTGGGIPELVAWDLSKLAVAAHLAGQTVARDAVMQVILQSLEAADGAHNQYDVIALAGAVWASSVSGVDLNPGAGTWAAAETTADLAAALSAFQTPGGGFVGGTNLAFIDDNADGQSTAYAMLALHSADPAAYASQIADGFNYIASLQQPSGQFLVYTGAPVTSPGGVESHAETFEAFSTIELFPDRWVAAAGGVDAGDCSVQLSPCATISYAVSQSGNYNIVHVATGIYLNPVTVTQEGLRIVGNDPLNKPVITRVAGPVNQPLLVINGPRNVQIENIEFRTDQSFVAEAILVSGFVDGLTILNNDFVHSQTGAPSSSFGLRNAISINLVNNSLGLPRVNGSNVRIEGNSIVGVAGAAGLRAGIAMDAGVGVIRNNTVTSISHDVIVRFATVVAGSSGTTLSIDHNTLGGGGIEFDAPNGGIGSVSIDTNIVTAPPTADSYPDHADFSLVRMIDNQQNIPTTLSNNQFLEHANFYRGVLIENYPGVQLLDNVFTPKAGSADFVNLVVSNKEVNTDAPADAPYNVNFTALRNAFNGNGMVNVGRAVEFINDNDAGGTSNFGPLDFGSGNPADANSFDGNLRWYYRLDDHNCETVNVPTCSFLGYSAAIGSNPATSTQVRPFRFSVNAINNNYAGISPPPSGMTVTQQAQLHAHTFDQLANGALGLVNYGLAANNLLVYVDDGFAGSTFGDTKSFTHSDTGTLNVQFGVNGFATIPDGLAHVVDGGTVYVAKGTYTNVVSVLQDAVKIVGDGSDLAGTVVTAGFGIAASGTSSLDPLLVSKLRVSNAAGEGIRLTGSRSYITLNDVVASGNAGNGMLIYAGGTPTLTTGLNIVGSHFDNNGPPVPGALVAGLNIAEDASIDGLTISGSSFNSNNGAGLTVNNIGSPSSLSQIRNVQITGSDFSFNNPVDAGAAGGGLWLKTGGSGSLIDGFSVSGSTFADNGSTNSLNRVGITVRARGVLPLKSTMKNVLICNNVFSETGAASAQLTGINVVDDTGNDGYEPIEICASNSFNGLAHSVSGLEQKNLRGTQPVVNITGGAIANTEFINSPVVRLSDSAQFPSFTSALNDSATLAGETLTGGAGLYTENIVVNTNNMTIRGIGNATVIEGTTGTLATPVVSTSPGITLANAVSGTTVRDLMVRNYNSECVLGSLSNSGSTIDNIDVDNCQAPSPNAAITFFGGAGIQDVTIRDSDVGNSYFRGIVIWDGYKQNISITDNTVHDITGCCGIELQDGTASGVTVTGNVVNGTGDSGMAFIGLTSGAGPNLIANNTISNRGRFGIEIKLPDGTGAESGDGSIVVRNNQVTLTAAPTDVRDIAGIAVQRRGFVAGNADVPAGVVVRDNTVTGYQPGGGNDGFGIVVEGVRMHVFGNTVVNSQIGLQLQAGNAGYPGDSDQSATNTYFSRGNSPTTCAMVGSNTYTSVGTAFREVGPVGLSAHVYNSDSGLSFCTIQAAINDAGTLAGHTLVLDDDISFAEQTVVTKSLTITRSNTGNKPRIVTPAVTNGDLALMRVNAPDVIIDGIEFDVDLARLGEAIRTVGGTAGGGVNPSGLKVLNNDFFAGASSNTLVSYGRRNALSLNLSNSSGYAPPNEQVPDLINVEVRDNQVSGTQDWDGNVGNGNQPAWFRAAIALDSGSAVITGNNLLGRDYDAILRFSSAGLDVSGNNQFRGGGVQLSAPNGSVAISGNLFDPTETAQAYAGSGLVFGDLGSSSLRLITSQAPLVVSGNTFNDHTNAIYAQNVNNWTLQGNTFSPRAGTAEFRHLIIDTKTLSSDSNTIVQVPLALAATGNTFNGAANGSTSLAIALEMVNHDADNAAFGVLSFGGPGVGEDNQFNGDFSYYFRLDPTTCAASNSACVQEPYKTSYQFGGFPATAVAPFGPVIVQAPNNRFDGTLPADMTGAQRQALQVRTFHNEPLAPEVPPAPPSLGRVDYGIAAGTISIDGAVAGTLTRLYSGAPQAVSATTNPPGLSYSVSYSSGTPPVNAGSYTVTATLTEPGYSGTAIATLQIDKAVSPVNFSGNLNPVYDGNAHALTAVLSQEPGNALACTLDYPGTTPPTNAGSSTVTATCVGNNYTGTASTSLTVVPKLVTINLVSGSFVYDGIPHPASASVSGLVAPDTIALDLSYNGVASAPVNTGSYLTVASFQPAAAPNYSALPAVGSLTITPAVSVITINPADLQQSFGATHAVGATASPPPSGPVSVTYNGSAAVPTAVGSYVVFASTTNPNYTGSATANLIVSDGANVSVTAAAPEMALIGGAAPYTDFVDYASTLANSGLPTSQPVHYRISVVRIDDGNSAGGQPSAIAADDVQVCLYDPSGWAAQEPGNHHGCPQDYETLFFSQAAGVLNGRPATTFRYPINPANDQPLPALAPTVLPPTKLQFKRGEYRVQIDIIGADNSTLYASADAATSVPSASIVYSGATSGATETPLLSTTTLGNAGGRVVGNVIVRISLSDAAATPGSPIALNTGDADLSYLNGGNYDPLPWAGSTADGGLYTWFGPPAGFALPDGYLSSTAGRGIFHRDGNYRLVYEVLDVATGLVVYATEQKNVSIGLNLVSFSLSDLNQVYNGTPRAVTVNPLGIPQQVIYEPAVGSCPVAPLGSNTVAPTDAGSYCVYVAATGSYSGSASATLVVSKASAQVTLDGAVGSVVSRTYNAAAQVVTASTLASLTGNIEVRYDGSTTAPTPAGSYSLLATIVDPNVQGSTTGTLSISTVGGTSIVLDGVAGDGKIHRSYSGTPVAAVTATTTPVGISYGVTYVGEGGTSYPLSTTVPSATGQYHVEATLLDANYDPQTASGTLVVENAAALSLTVPAGPLNTSVGALLLADVRLENTGDPLPENALLRYTVSRTASDIAVTDLTVDYTVTTAESGNLGFVDQGLNLVAYSGAQPGGFDVYPAYDHTTSLSALFNVVGSYNVTVDLVAADGVPVAPFASGSFVIEVVASSAAISINGSSGGVVNRGYNGAPQVVSASTTPANLAYALSYTGINSTTYPTSNSAPSDAGEYSVAASISQAGYVGVANATLVIARATGTVNFAGASSVVYDGNPHAFTASIAQEPATACVLTPQGGAQYPRIDVGTTDLSAVCDGQNYTAVGNASLVVTPRPVLLALTGLGSIVYDGNDHPAAATVDGLTVATPVVDIAYNGTALLPNNAGSYAVTASLATTETNYSAASVSGNITITKAPANAVITGGTFTWDGLPHPAVISNPNGVAYSIGYDSVGGGVPVDAGSYIATLNVSDPNYAQAATTAPIQINKASADVTLGSLLQVYDGSAKSATAVTNPAGIAVSLAYAGGPPVAAGGYAISVTSNNPNVDIGTVNPPAASLTISKAPATISFGTLAFNYDGNPQPTTASTTEAGACSIDYNGATAGNGSAPVDAGNYSVVANCDGPNHSGSATATISIARAPVSIGLSGLGPYTYDGVDKTASASVSGALNGDVIVANILYNAAATPLPRNAGSYSVTAQLPVSASNYVAATAAGTLLINKAPTTLTLGNLSQTFGSVTAVTASSSATLSGTIDILYDGVATLPTAVGNYAVAATVNDTNYNGAAAGTLTIAPANANAIQANSATSGLAGDAGAPFSGVLPSVKVVDAGNNPVAGVNVSFAVTAGGGILSGASQITNSGGIATLGGWTFGAQAGGNSVRATATGVSGNVDFDAVTVANVGLSVSVDDGRSYTQVGKVLNYFVSIGNSGPSDAVGLSLTSTLPAELNPSSVHWVCNAAPGSSCPAATGTGNLPNTLTIAHGGSINFLLSGSVLGGGSESIVYSVSATRPVGSNGNDASDNDVTDIVLFRDGFEAGGDGAGQLDAVTLGESFHADGGFVGGVDFSQLLGFSPQTWINGATRDGCQFAAEFVRANEQAYARWISADRQGLYAVGAWHAWPDGSDVLSLALTSIGEGMNLSLASDNVEIATNLACTATGMDLQGGSSLH